MKNVITFALKALPLSCLLGSCYILPIDQYGNPVYPPPSGTYSSQTTKENLPPPSGPITITARLYPDNEIAAESGVITGTVTNMLTGKGRFNLNYKGEAYSGEATRISNDTRQGVASAFSQKGGYMSCEYQMNTPRQGAGSCLFSNGARYKLHLGN